MSRTPAPSPATATPTTIRVEFQAVGTHANQPFQHGTVLDVSPESAEHLVSFGIGRLATPPAEPTTDTPTA